MPQPFDTSAKYLLTRYPADWLVALLAPDLRAPVTPLEPTLTLVNRRADGLFLVEVATPWLLHVELQANADPRLDQRRLEYNVLLSGQHDDQPIRSVAVLLRPLADRAARSGLVQRAVPEEDAYLRIRYTVLRLWEQPVDRLLAGGLGALPLAPLGAVPEGGPAAVVRAVGERLNREVEAAEGDVLWLCTYILTGLRYAPATLLPLFEGVRVMQESATYQAILAEGRAEDLAEGETRGLVQGARLALVWLGEARFGPPDVGTRAALEAIDDVKRLEALTRQLDRVASWPELLAR